MSPLVVGCDFATKDDGDHSGFCLMVARRSFFFDHIPWWLYLLGRLRLAVFIIEQ